VKTGKVTSSNRAYLGIEIADTAEATGVTVTKVLPGTAAAKAGIAAGDRITSLNGTKTPTSSDLSTALAGLKPGQTVKVVVVHQGGAKATLSLTLGEFPGASS